MFECLIECNRRKNMKNESEMKKKKKTIMI